MLAIRASTESRRTIAAPRRLAARGLFRAFAAGLVLLVLLGRVERAEADDDRFTVCSITINSDDEIRGFREHLPASQFRFVELTTLAQTPAKPGGDWLSGACQSGVHCDVLVLSAHFGNTWAGDSGTTFAGKSGLTLPLGALERRRCEDSCPGVLGDPLEVFLFGCKTLADDSDTVLGASDAALLRGYGLATDSATRALDEARNRGEDSSSLRRMRYVFGGVPHVYGFTDVAPSGAHVAPLVDRYLRSVGDYAAHLRALRRAARDEAVARNELLARALEPTCFAETAGLDPAGMEYARRTEACTLRDERRPIAVRLDRVVQMLDGGRFWPSLAAVDTLLAETRAAPAGDAVARLRAHAGGREQALALIHGLDDPVLRLEVLRVASTLGWVSEADAVAAYRAIVVRLLAPPVYGEARDLVCGLGPDVLDKIALHADDLAPAVYREEFAIQALACLKPADPIIRERLAASLTDSREWIARLAAVALRGGSR